MDTTSNLYHAAFFKDKTRAISHLKREQDKIRKIILSLEERYNDTGADRDLSLIETWTSYTKWYNGEVVEYELTPTGNNYLVQDAP